MEIPQIVTYKDKLIREKSQPVENINKDIKKLIDKMFLAMEHYNGIGLAAVQIGVPLRVITVDIKKEYLNNERATHFTIALINPEIITSTTREEEEKEGCLSVPGIEGEVPRKFGIEVEGYTLDERLVKLSLFGLPARVVQHEIDHLDGILFIDRLPPYQKKKILKILKKK